MKTLTFFEDVHLVNVIRRAIAHVARQFGAMTLDTTIIAAMTTATIVTTETGSFAVVPFDSVPGFSSRHRDDRDDRDRDYRRDDRDYRRDDRESRHRFDGGY